MFYPCHKKKKKEKNKKNKNFLKGKIVNPTQKNNILPDLLHDNLKKLGY